MIPLEQIKDFYQAFVDGLDAVLGDKLFGVYLYGAVAFPESGPTRDINFHVILRETLTDGESAGLYDLHASLAREYPGLGGEKDVVPIHLSRVKCGLVPPMMRGHCIANTSGPDAASFCEVPSRNRCILPLRGRNSKRCSLGNCDTWSIISVTFRTSAS